MTLGPDARRQLLLYGLAFGCFFQQSVLFPVLPRFAGEFGISVAAIGIVLGLRFLAPALLAAQIGSFASRIGLRRSLVIAGIGMVVSALLYVVAVNVAILVLAQVVNGLLYLLAWISAQTYATRMPNRDFVLGIFATFTAIGMAIAPILGGIALDLGGYGAAFGLYGVSALALALNACALGDAPIGRPMAERAKPRRGRALELLSRPGIQAAFMFSFLCLFTISLRGNILPIFLEEAAFSASAIGLVLGAGSLGQAAVRPFTHALLERFSLSVTIFIAVALGAAGIALMPLFGTTGILLVLAFLHGGGAGLHQSLGLVLVADDTDDAERGYAVGLRATVNQVSVAGAPVLGGAVAYVLGVGPAIAVAGALVGLGGIWLFGLLRRVERVRAATADAARKAVTR